LAAYDYDIGILGGGAAGLTVASGAARLGAKTLLVEKEEALGGDCLHYGCVPSKTLIKTASVLNAMRRAASYGLPPVNSPPVDFQMVRERIRSVISAIQRHDSVERFCGLGVRIEFGTPSFFDEHSIMLGGNLISAAKWVIATGSSPAVPAIEGIEKTHFITNREIFYLDRLPQSMVVLGAGPISVEMAQAFCRLGTKVTVIQRSGQILTREDKDMADAVMNALADEGVSFRLNSTVEAVSEKGGLKEVVIKRQGGGTDSITAERILVAMGREPNIGGLNLERIGVECDAKGIKVDGRMRTSMKHIYAAGDVTGRFQFTHAAGYEGGIVIANAVFRLPRRADYRFLPWCTYTEPELASIGMNEKAAAQAGIEYSVISESFAENDRALAEGAGFGKIKMIVDGKGRAVGIQILGLHAGELINEWVAALNGGVKLSTLASSVHPYPTLGEINKRTAGAFLAPKIFSERMRKGLKLLFNLKGRAC
jgi:pyruvate/2-oxoglutarate dehydrogenase complex dihydrolipoamide dehydrogenase (E3) component